MKSCILSANVPANAKHLFDEIAKEHTYLNGATVAMRVFDSIENLKAGKYNSDFRQYCAMYNYEIDDNDKNKFHKVYTKENGKKVDITKKAILDYHNYRYPNIKYSVSKTRPNYNAQQYADIESRIFAIDRCAVAILNKYIKTKFENNQQDKLTTDDYIGEIRRFIMIALYDAIKKNVPGKTRLGLKEEYIQHNHNIYEAFIKYCCDDLGNFTNPIYQNLFALWSEVHNEETAQDVFKEIFNNPRLFAIRKTSKDVHNAKNIKDITYEVEDEIDNEEALIDEDNDNNHQEETSDNMVKDLNNKGQLTGDVLDYLDTDIKIYFACLPKYTPKREFVNGELVDSYVKDENTPLGVSDTMDMHQCLTILYSYNNKYNSYEDFIATVEDIAKKVPGFRAFNEFIKQIKKNEAFGRKCYQMFNKPNIQRFQTDVSGDNVRNKITNDSSRRYDALVYSLAEEYQATIIQPLSSEEEDILTNLSRTDKGNYNRKDNTKNNLKEIKDTVDEEIFQKNLYQLVQLFKHFIPTINEESIENYLRYNGDNIRNNFLNLANLVNSLNSDSKKYIETIEKLSYEKTKLINEINDLERHKTKNNAKERVEKAEKKKEIEYELYLYDIKSNFKESNYQPILNIVNTILDYYPVDIDLNGYGVNHKQNTNFINTNYLTDINRILSDDEIASNWAANLAQSQQYDYSNILFWRKDNPNGIFIQKKGKWVFNTGGKEMFKVMLFNGIANQDYQTNANWHTMSDSDFINTAFSAFINGIKKHSFSESSDINSIFFLRTPSDAINQYVVSTKKYEIQGLFNYNYNDNGVIFNEVDQINKFIKEHLLEQDYTTDSINRSRNIFRDDIISKKDRFISFTSKKVDDKTNLPNEIIVTTDENENKKYAIKCCYRYKTNNEVHQFYYLMSGDEITQINSNNFTLRNVKFEGFINANDDEVKIYDYDVNTKYQKHNWSYAELKKVFYKNDKYNALIPLREALIVNNELKHGINNNHAIFKAYKNIFYQELLDAIVQAYTIFRSSSVDGNLVLETTKDHKLVLQEGKELNRLIDNYHKSTNKRKESSLYRKDGSLAGNVFHSNKFQIYTNVDGKLESVNIGDNVLQTILSFLYGGAQDATQVKITKANDKYSFTLSKEIEQQINEMISNYIINTVNNEIEVINRSEDNIQEEFNTFDNKAEFILNYQLFYNNCDELLDGSTKFYADSTEIFKREKEVQGSGEAFTNINWHNPFYNVREQGKGQFTAVTIRNTVGTEDMFKIGNKEDGSDDGIITKELTKQIEESTGNKVFALRQARFLMSKFAFAKMNDAISYITYECWKQRVEAKGELDKYQHLIDKIEDPNSIINIEDISEFMQVQKNFYYDQVYDNEFHTRKSRQIKNAEFVLCPRFIKGTQLETLYNIMRKHNIDQVNTEEAVKAGKANILTFWDNEGKLTEQNLISFERDINIAREFYDYRYLRSQIETPQHINQNNKAGIQFLKKIVDNVSTSKNEHLKELYKEFMQITSAKIKQSANIFLASIGVNVDNHGNIVFNEDGKTFKLDYNVFFDRFAEELARINQNSNMMDCVTLDPQAILQDNTIPQTIMPTFHNGVSNKLESIAQALFRNAITRQKLPGFHGPQITNIGWQGTNSTPYQNIMNPNDNISSYAYHKLSEEEQNKYRDTRVGYESELQYHPMTYKNKVNNTIITQREYNELTKSEKDNYEENGIANYIEIKLPKSNFNFKLTKEDGTQKTEKELLKELQDEGLDKVVGYRIPTESKHSIGVMKVVGFIDDSYGTTIVVPNAWVPQTGSDFDIDTIYGINHATYLDHNGIIHKIKYKNEADETDYWRYVNEASEQVLRNEQKDFIENNRKNPYKHDAEDYYQETYNMFMDKFSDLFYSLPQFYIDLKKYVDKEFRDLNISLKRNNKKEYFIGLLNNAIKEFKRELVKQKQNKNLNHDKDYIVEDYINFMQDIVEFLSGNGIYAERYNELKQSDKLRNKIHFDVYYNAIVNEIAEAFKLLTFDEFKEQSPLEFNSMSAKDNRILDIAIEIAEDPSMLEETLSANSIDAITDVVAEVRSDETTTRKLNRSPYRFTDQLANRSDAMSGVSLKALSVVFDNLTSLCNNIHPNLAKDYSITIQYPLSEYKLENGKLDKDKIDILFKTFNVDESEYNKKIQEARDKGYFEFTHDKIGWSNNNRNVEGNILTDYTSKTSQHAFDAVKEGSVPNVNTFTLGVYKIFSMVGSDYKTAISFIMQPGITEIIKVFESNKSIFSTGYSPRPILNAFKNVAEKLGISYRANTSIYEIFNNLNNNKEYIDAIKKIFNIPENDNRFQLYPNDNAQTDKLAINSELYTKRLKGLPLLENSTLSNDTINNLFDLCVILQFDKIKKLADKLSAISSVINPDKFGAKQTLYATTDIFYKLMDLNSDSDPALVVKDKSFIETLYPGIQVFDEKINMIDNILNYFKYKNKEKDNQEYDYLDAHLRYGTALSILINNRIFISQNDNFIKTIRDIQSLFGPNAQLTEQIFTNYREYLINSFYRTADEVQYNYTYNVQSQKFERYILNTNVTFENLYAEEIRRIGGYGHDANFNLKINDINNPTQYEINKFALLSPAKKVLFIKSKFENSGIFNYLIPVLVNTYEQRKEIYRQVIKCKDNSINIEEALNLFNEAYYNNNPLIKLAALDLIKYSLVVEGGKMRRNGESKIVKGIVLKETINNDVNEESIIQHALSLILNENDNPIQFALLDDNRENFVRANYNSLTQIPAASIAYLGTRMVTYEGDEKATPEKYYEVNYRYNGCLIFDLNNENQAALAEKYHIVSTTGDKDTCAPYVKLKKSNENEYDLYKFEYLGKGIVFGYPLNKLDTFENSEFSSIYKNKFKHRDYYKTIRSTFKDYIENNVDETVTDKNLISTVVRAISNETNAANKKEEYKTPKFSKPKSSPYINIFTNSNNIGVTDDYSSYGKAFIDKLNSNSINADCIYYFSDITMHKFIPEFGIRNGLFNEFELTPGNKRIAVIQKVFDTNNTIKLTPELQTAIREDTGKVFDDQSAAKQNIYSIRLATQEEQEKYLKDRDISYASIEEESTYTDVNELDFIEDEQEVILDESNRVLTANEQIHKLARTGLYYIRKSSIHEDAVANKLLRKIENRNKTISEYVNDNLAQSLNILNQYMIETSTQMNDAINAFYKDSDGIWHGLNDPVTLKALTNNKRLMQKYLKLVLDNRLLKNKFDILNHINIDELDESLKETFKSILAIYKHLTDNPEINKSFTEFAQEYLSKFSKDPRVLSGMLSVYNGYYSTSLVEAMFNDLQDNGNTLIQIVTNICMNDLNTAVIKGEQLKRQWHNDVKKLLDEAATNGKSIDYSKFIENGRFKTPYTEQFNVDYNTLKTNLREARLKYEQLEEDANFDVNKNADEVRSAWKKYLKAEYEYKKFKAKYLHQEVADKYYETELKLLENILFINNEKSIYTDTYAEYRRLDYLRRKLYSNKTHGILSKEQEEQLNVINERYNILIGKRSLVTYESATGNAIFYSNDPIYDTEVTNKLREYIDKFNTLRKEYYTFEVDPTFETNLEKCLQAMSAREKRDADGQIINYYELKNDAEYQNALAWLHSNAKFEVDPEVLTIIQNAYKEFSHEQSASKVNQFAVKHNAYDSQGRVDATKFSDDEIKQIKEQQESEFRGLDMPYNANLSLLKAIGTPKHIFAKGFYNRLKLDTNHDPKRREEYNAIIKVINEILGQYYVNADYRLNEPINDLTGTVDVTALTYDEIDKLFKLYEKLHSTKKYEKHQGLKKAIEEVMSFIETETEVVYNEDRFNRDYQTMLNKKKNGSPIESAKATNWINAFTKVKRDSNGNILKDSEGNEIRVPSNLAAEFVYGFIAPKGYKYNGNEYDNLELKYTNKQGHKELAIDSKRTMARDNIRKYTKKATTPYYEAAKIQAWKQGNDYYNKWYNENHIYNPISKQVEPLRCWTKTEYGWYDDQLNSFKVAGHYVPSYAQTTRTPINPNKNYDSRGGFFHNYKPSQNSPYNRELNLNPYEQRMKDLMIKTITENTLTTLSRKRAEKGYLPTRFKDSRTIKETIKDELLKTIGVYYHTTDMDNKFFAEASYDTDVIPPMPLYSNLRTAMLKSKTFIEPTAPIRNKYATQEEYNAAYKEYEIKHKKYEEDKAKHIKEVNDKYNSSLDENYVDIIGDFVEQAVKYNTVQQDKLLLEYGRILLQNQNIYQTIFGINKFKKENYQFSTVKDTNLLKQYDNWALRYIYGQYKDSDTWINKAANIAQSITSAKFMWLNLRSAAANVHTGGASIIGEAFAKEFFNKTDWWFAKKEYYTNLSNYIISASKDESTTLASAFIKFFKILDIDQFTGVVIVNDLNKKVDKARNTLFGLQTSGEHIMQNTALFAMLHNYRVAVQQVNGVNKLTLINEDEQRNKIHEDALLELFNRPELAKYKIIYEKYKKSKLGSNNPNDKKDANPQVKKDYIWLKRNVVTEFLNIFMSKYKVDFGNIVKQKEEELNTAFADEVKHPRLWDQFELTNGFITLKKDSKLYNYNQDNNITNPEELSNEVLALLGEFRSKVIGVNKKIHGYYDKMSAAQIEKFSFGSLIMQYHKHLPMGILKHWRRKGYFNEQRGIYEKGMYASVYHFLSIPFRNKKLAELAGYNRELNEEELQTIEHYQNTLHAVLDFYLHLKTNYNTLTNYDKANIKRFLTESAIVAIAAIGVAFGKSHLDDDDDDSELEILAKNFIVYQADRLASEVGLYSPFGLPTEIKTIWSNPVATASIAGDILQLAEMTIMSATQPDFDWYYHNSMYAGEHKALVKIKHMVPIVYSYQSLMNLSKSNKYYKLGNTTLSFIPTKAMANGIKEIREDIFGD